MSELPDVASLCVWTCDSRQLHCLFVHPIAPARSLVHRGSAVDGCRREQDLHRCKVTQFLCHTGAAFSSLYLHAPVVHVPLVWPKPFHSDLNRLHTGAKRSGCRPRPRATTACARTSARRSGRATSGWRASTSTWAAMTARLLQPRPLTRRSCCAMSTAAMARTLPHWSPTSRQNTTRQARSWNMHKLC